MSTPLVVEATDISLAYRLTRSRPGTFKEFAIQALRRQVQHEKLWALQNVTVKVAPGEVLGIIGPNGAGKSTLMKVIARVLPPTKGRAIIRGTVAAMIELGAGFNAEMTGQENVVLYGTLLGRDSASMVERVPAIAEWAGLEGFMDVPVRSYSSGMLARLGFAVATDVKPDLLVVDEVLSVGDAEFQQKSRARIFEMIDGGTAVVLVSHNLSLVKEVSDRVMLLEEGRNRGTGSPIEIVDAYRDTHEPDAD
jgi:ABC-type polysaccharide/polyol phosphate transport system ATPase subunit